MAVAETSLVKRISKSQTNVNQKITKKLIEKVPMTAIAKSLSISTSTVIRKLKAFKTDLYFLPNHMAWDEYSYKKGKLVSLHRTLIPERSSLTCIGRLKWLFANISLDMVNPYYFIALLLAHTWPIMRFSKSSLHTLKNSESNMNSINYHCFISKILITLNIKKERTNLVLSRL